MQRRVFFSRPNLKCISDSIWKPYSVVRISSSAIFHLLGSRTMEIIVCCEIETDVCHVIADECCLLPSQVMIPTLSPVVESTAVASPALCYQALPILLEFGVEPDCLHFVPELSPFEGAMQLEQTVDFIRHIYLGKYPIVVKQCSRCGGKAQVQSMTRTAAIRAWDQRWARACRCGGHWQMHSFV